MSASHQPEPLVVVGMPRRDNTACVGAMQGLQNAVSRPIRVLELELPPCSLLNHSFNMHWAQALNCRDQMGATHFAMIHADIAPQAGWLTILLDELTAVDADVVSAVVPLKDERGLTSTAVYDDDPWDRRRLTLAEVAELPETFNSEDIGGRLMVNTGLWVCDLSKPWCDSFVFHSLERIVNRDGRRVAEVVSEDWLLSHELNEAGAAVYATRKVQLTHEGGGFYPSGGPWGAWQTDEDCQERREVAAA